MRNNLTNWFVLKENGIVPGKYYFTRFILLLFLFFSFNKSNSQVVILSKQVFVYTGSDQVLTTPSCVNQIKIKIWGAGGGGSFYQGENAGGGAGGYVEGLLAVNPGNVFSVMVGEGGVCDGAVDNISYGFGGSYSAIAYGGFGGGLSGIFTGAVPITQMDQARALLIAGGGGGSERDAPDGYCTSAGQGGDVTFGGGMPNMNGQSGGIGGGGGGGYSGGLITLRLSCNGSYTSGEGGTNFIHASVTSGVSISSTDFGNCNAAPAMSKDPPNVADADYSNGIGMGSMITYSQAGHGRVVVEFYGDTSLLPSVSITPSAAVICSGTPVTFTANGATTYSWNTGATTASIQTVPTADTTYTVIGYNAGCADSAVATVTVNPKPVITVNSVILCAGDTDTLTATGANTYLWNTGVTTNSIIVSPVTDTSYIVIGTTSGCSDTAVSTVIAHPLPDAKFSTANVCDGSNVLFNDLSTIPGTGIIQSWSWNFGDGSSVSSNQNTSHLYPAIGFYNAQLLVVSNFGCRDSIVRKVVVNPNPVVNFSADDTVGCEPVCVNFQDLSTNNFSWVWNFGDGSIVNTTQNPTHCYTNDSIFAPITFNIGLTVTSDSGCVTTFSKNNYITVYPNPNANFTVQPQTTTITDPIISFANLSTGGNFWNWNMGDLDSSSLQNPLPHTYADTGTYVISLITSTLYGCIDTAYQTITIEPEFVFYIPNAFSPNGDNINDTFTGKGIFIKEYEMRIFDRWGMLIFYTNDLTKPWDGKANYGSEMAQQDVYVWKVQLSDVFNKKHNYIGTVTIVK